MYAPKHLEENERGKEGKGIGTDAKRSAWRIQTVSSGSSLGIFALISSRSSPATFALDSYTRMRTWPTSQVNERNAYPYIIMNSLIGLYAAKSNVARVLCQTTPHALEKGDIEQEREDGFLTHYWR